MPAKSRKIRAIFFIYWFLLAYIIAALIWWFIALSRQNTQMTQYRLAELKTNDAGYTKQKARIINDQQRKTTQYIGEGLTFLLLIAGGAWFVYRAVKNQFALNRQQQHFMIAVTHELKTPIAVTKLNLETLKKRKLDEEQQHRLINNSLQETDRMNALCNNLLLSSQMDTGGYSMNLEPVSLQPLLESCVDDFRSRYPQKIIHFSGDANKPVQGDAFLLQLAFNNIIDNAIKYAPKETALHLNLKINHDQVIIEIADEGPGIADADKNRIFEKFSRLGNEATRQSKGTGLGLYLTQKIIRAHHGHIFVTDHQPKGALFSIELPLIKETT